MDTTGTVEPDVPQDKGSPQSPASAFPYLTITDGQGLCSTFTLDRGMTWRIGRDQGLDVVLQDEAVSRRHAAIQRSEWGEYYVLDLGSRNGTFIWEHGVRTPAILKDGDEITIGGYSLIFHHKRASSVAESVIPASDDQMNRTRVVFAERLLSVLVVDIHGYTALAQHTSPDTLCSFIHDWFSDASRIFRAHGSWTMKYIGDAVMATWLHEADRDKTPILACLSAIDELARVTNPERYSLQVPLRFGAGLNTGLASIGNAGSGDQPDFTALGDTVNSAFRIEAGTRQLTCDVAIGAHCVRLLGGVARVTPYLQEHLLELKGYSERVPVWAGSFDDLRALQASMAGS